MKKQILTMAFVAAGVGAIAEGDAQSTMTVITQESQVEWLGKKVTGEHYGEISISKGDLQLENDVLTGGSFEIDMKSIVCKDLDNQEYNQKLVGHLKSDDFFGVEKYPTASLVITGVEKKGSTKYMVQGDITIKGVTKSISFPTQVAIYGEKASATASITIDRSDFNVKFGSGSFFDGLGDKMIYDEFTLDVTLVANK
ncbi:MAG: YceI family protein [Cyclobacteriaceae bacterium]|nr:YceI family protein [Cyclobacteriaceae bacterium]